VVQTAPMAIPRTYVAQTTQAYRSPRTLICHRRVRYVGVQDLDAALGTEIVTKAKEAVVAASVSEGPDSEPCVPYGDDNAFAVGTTSVEH
jgi:hypothetical protein